MNSAGSRKSETCLITANRCRASCFSLLRKQVYERMIIA